MTGCRECGGALEPTWVACPSCGAPTSLPPPPAASTTRRRTTPSTPVVLALAGGTVVLSIAAIVAVSVMIATPSGPGPLTTVAQPQPTAAMGTPGTPSPPTETLGALARAAVQVVPLVRIEGEWAPVGCWGSGSIVDAGGLVLTNAHVIDGSDDCGYEAVGISVLEEPDQPPVLSYLAETAAFDPSLDLAVVRIVTDLDGVPVSRRFPTVAIGDPSSIDIGDRLRILGFPGIGGETVTLTTGVVSGFTSERGTGERGWIKTDASISGGNSGGMAVDDSGRLIGIPTVVGAGDTDGDTVDCRYVVDTNRDGVVDDRDTCVPVGGFINGLRPVDLAAPLIVDARGGAVVSADEIEPVDPDLAEAIFSSLVFAADVSRDDTPVDPGRVFPPGTSQICGFWDYEGMEDGLGWEALWFVDGVLDEGGSRLGQVWEGGPDGGNWWVCISDDHGLSPGLYELSLLVEGVEFLADSAFVGRRQPATLTVRNDAETEICYLYVSPSLAQSWGEDDLGPEETVPPGDSVDLELPSATYDIAADDCDGVPIDEVYGVDVSGDAAVTIELNR